MRKLGLLEPGLSDSNNSAVRATFLVVFLLAGFLPLLHATTRTLLFNYRQLSALRNVVGGFARRDVCDQLADLFAGVVDWNRRVDVEISVGWQARFQ